MAANGRLHATVPLLDGGPNRGTDAAHIADTQLSDGCNLRYVDGALRTRAGLVTDLTRQDLSALMDGVQYMTDRDGYLLVLSWGDSEAYGELCLTVFDRDGVPTGGFFSHMGILGLRGFLVAAGNADSVQPYTTLLFTNEARVYGIHAADGRVTDLTDTGYVPLLRPSGVPTADRTDHTLTGVPAEPLNRLSDLFRCRYSTDGVGIYYYLPTFRTDAPITVELCRRDGTLTFVAEGDESEPVGGYTLQVDRHGGCVWFAQDGAPVALPSEGLRGDLTVTLSVTSRGGARPGKMRFGTWYGGDRSGTVSGSRLFLGGEDGFVMWSAVGDPLYFPATAYAQVGDPDEPVTAFGKQGELLVLFKAHSLYAVEYLRSDTATAEQVERGEVTDVTATALFPITPIHAEIGCDLPQTVALLGNRLLWACAAGTVYTLSGTGALSDRRVTVVSEPIRPLLRARRPTVAAAVVTDGRYRLLWDQTLFTATDDTAPRWWRDDISTIGAMPSGLCRVDGALRLAAAYTVGNVQILFWFSEAGAADTVITHTGEHWGEAVYTLTPRPVVGFCTTKQFDFGTPDAYKRVTHLFADATASGAVKASYVTERGTYTDLPRVPRDGVRLTPGLSRLRRIALRLEGEGLAVGSITFHLKEEQGWPN